MPSNLQSLGAYVATTVNTNDKQFVQELGANQVIDYRAQNFEDILHDYDAVVDTVGGEMYRRSFKVLKKGGIIVSMLEQPNSELPPLVRLSALRLVKDCNEAIFGLTANGPSVLAVKKITERANALGLVGSSNDSNSNKDNFMI